ncbi:MAG: sugar transferase [Actinomycetota bacterium]|nr:sugar transferase [Actinomycetota bacterium]
MTTVVGSDSPSLNDGGDPLRTIANPPLPGGVSASGPGLVVPPDASRRAQTIGAVDTEFSRLPLGTSGRPAAARVGSPRRAPRRGGSGTWQRRYLRRVLLVDLLAGGCAALLGLLRFEPGTPSTPYVVLTVVLPLAWLAALGLARGYETRFLFVGTDEYRRVTTAALWLAAILVMASFAVRFGLARGYAAITLTFLVVATLLGRHALRQRLHRARQRGECMSPVLVMGYERAVAGLCRQLLRMPHHGMQVVGALLPAARIHPDALSDVGVPVIGAFEDAAAAVARTGADTVAVLACPELDGQALRRLAWELEKTRTDLIVAPALIDTAGARTTIRPIDGLPMLHVEHPEFTGGRRLVKGLMDRLLAALAVLVLGPMLLVLAVLIRRDSPGPALFRQERVGRDGTRFRVLKFRTMHVGAESMLAGLRAQDEGNGILFKMRDDPRVTRVGRVLRRYSLDELPQLFNVLAGQMSLVGPRPPLAIEVEQYESDAYRRLVVKPGLTGLWQISGRSDLSWEETVRLDLRYVENWSLTSDLLILVRTISAVARSAGAY